MVGFGTLGASLLGNMLPGNWGQGVITASKGKYRAGKEFQCRLIF